jgi:hypothetical protein
MIRRMSNGGVFPSRDCRENPGVGLVPRSVPELHRKARTAPGKKGESMVLGYTVVGIIFLPLYSDVFTFGIICDMNFISHCSTTSSFSHPERVISPCKALHGILFCHHVKLQRLREE